MGKVLSRITAVCAVALCVVSACNTSGCLENQSSILLAGFYSMDTKNAIVLSSVAIGGVGAPDDSLLLSPNSSAARLYLPFRSDYSSVAYFISYYQQVSDTIEDNDTVWVNTDTLLIGNDTLWIDYDSEPYFASEECGAMYRYTITSLEYTRNIVDSIGIADSLVNNLDIERLKLYFRTFPTDTVSGE